MATKLHVCLGPAGQHSIYILTELDHLAENDHLAELYHLFHLDLLMKTYSRRRIQPGRRRRGQDIGDAGTMRCNLEVMERINQNRRSFVVGFISQRIPRNLMNPALRTRTSWPSKVEEKDVIVVTRTWMSTTNHKTLRDPACHSWRSSRPQSRRSWQPSSRRR